MVFMGGIEGAKAPSAVPGDSDDPDSEGEVVKVGGLEKEDITMSQEDFEKTFMINPDPEGIKAVEMTSAEFTAELEPADPEEKAE